MGSETYIAILRGINVSGNNMIKMPALKKMFEDAGFDNVKTYIQSGNVLFNYKSSETLELGEKIEREINREFKLTVPIVVLELKTIKKVFDHNPFLKIRKEDISSLHVTFLSENPEKEKKEKIDPDKYSPDEFIFAEKAIYLFCPNGYGRTKLTNNFFENKLKLTATTRNWKTVTELVRLGEELAAKS